MKSLITDIRLRKIYSIISNHLCYDIKIASLNNPSKNLYEYAVFYNQFGYWELRLQPGIMPDQNGLCHELMHICLCLEGWPIWYPALKIEEWQRLIVIEIINILQHHIVWERLPELGFVNPESYENFAEYFGVVNPAAYALYPAKAHSKLLAVRLLRTLLAPIPAGIKTQIQDRALRLCSFATIKARKFLELIHNSQKLNWQSSLEVQEKLLKELSMPTNTHRSEFLNTFVPGVYDQIRESL